MSGEGLEQTVMSGEGLEQMVMSGEGLEQTVMSGEALEQKVMSGEGLDQTVMSGEGLEQTVMSGEGLDQTVMSGEGLDQMVMSGEALERRNIWEPSVYSSLGKENFCFAGHDISIRESMDAFGALVWPGAVALCHFLENNRTQVDLMDKAVLEIGAGTGLLSIVACLLGAWVTATDLPDILSNLTFNLQRNTRGRCRYTPQVAALPWGRDLERDFPYASCRYDYVLAADVVYHHDNLTELLDTMRHFCRPPGGPGGPRGPGAPGGRTTLLWANKIRFQSDLSFTESFQSSFHSTLIMELPQEGVRIYRGTAKD